MRRFLVPLAFLWLLVGLLCPGSARAQGLGSWLSPGKLALVHQDIDTVTGCPQCHTPGQGPSPERCEKCHESVKLQVASKTGFHRNKGTECERCHGEHRGVNNKLIPDLSQQGVFDHKAETGWALEGKHARTRCIGCHTGLGTYTGLSKDCSSCHDDPHGKENSKRRLLEHCERCHGAADWNPLAAMSSVFDHTDPADADYLLEGQHLDVGCEDCHVDSKFVPLEFGKCTSCHVNPHRADAIKSKACEDCHPDAQTWEVPSFDHNETRYRLQGQHAKVECEECHKGDKTQPIAFSKCETCHADLHHGQFAPRTCDQCHTVQVAKFQLRDYDHDQTRYPLKGKHACSPAHPCADSPDVTCEQCHQDGSKAVYANLPFDDCDTCHEDSHHGRFEPAPCQKCHIEDGWEVNAFDHDTTDVPQTGKHVGLECNKCHRDYQWTNIPHDSCLDCHYTKNPHDTGITAEKCASCHVTDGFDVIRFDHLAETGFDLNPAHDQLECQACHDQVKDFAGLDSTCTACHQDDVPWGHYEGPCEDCHDAEHWSPAGLGDNDHAVTGFALTGVHALEPCESCHPPGEPRGTAEPACASCHSRDDVHQNMLGTACADCHDEMSWLRTSWRHSTTGWPLRGAHRLAACVDCHAAGYFNAPTECFRCHEADAYDCATPRCTLAHQSANFPECDSCHVVYAWTVGTDRYPH
jgi:hypothetical protein